MNYTKGKWNHNVVKREFSVDLFNSERIICKGTARSFDEAVEISKLISKAPEMHEALKASIDVINCCFSEMRIAQKSQLVEMIESLLNEIES